MKNILMITPAFPPYGGSHTQRMIAIANTMAKSGIKVFVLTYEIMKGHPTYSENTLKDIDESITVIRVPCGFLHSIAYRKGNYVEEKYKSSQIAKKRSSLKSIVIKSFDKIKDIIFIPDSIIDWKHNVLSYARRNRLFQSIKFDYIYSCAMPCSMHVIGHKLSKTYNVPLIMDYGDPWVYISGTKYKKHQLKFLIEKRLEKKIIEHSLYFSFSAKGCEKLYQGKYAIPPDKTCTIMTGYEDRLLDISNEHIMPIKTDKNIIMTYGGAIQMGVRNPVPLFKALEKFPNIIFNIRTDKVGAISELAKEKAPKAKINVMPYVPFEKYYSEMLDADILVFFGNSTSNQLPGKIFNYLPTGKPILYVSNIENVENDQAFEIVKDYGNFIFMKNSSIDAENALKKVLNWDFSMMLEKKANIEKYSNYNQCKKIADWIKEH